MATVYEKMTTLADAIREKTGTTEPLSLDQMAIEVMTIENNGEATEQPAYLDKIGLQRMWYNLSNRVNDKFMPTTIRQLGTDWYPGDGTQSSLICVHVAFADWSQEIRNAFLIPNKRYPVFWGGQTYLSYAKPYGNSAYLGNPALALDDGLKQLDDNGEDFCIYRYNDPGDPSSPYLMMIHRNIPLGSYPLKLYYPISENAVDLDLEFEGVAADAKAVGDAINAPKDYILLTDQVNGKKYRIYMRDGNLVSEREFDPTTDLVDFEYTDNSDGTYTLTSWKGTYNGEPSTEIIIPNQPSIIV